MTAFFFLMSKTEMDKSEPWLLYGIAVAGALYAVENIIQ